MMSLLRSEVTIVAQAQLALGLGLQLAPFACAAGASLLARAMQGEQRPQRARACPASAGNSKVPSTEPKQQNQKQKEKPANRQGHTVYTAPVTIA